MPSKMTKKQKVQNFITKNPEAGPTEIAKKLDVTPTYAGQIRRELAADLSLPPLKRGRKAKAKAEVRVATPKPEVRRRAKTNPQRAAWEELLLVGLSAVVCCWFVFVCLAVLGLQ